jgi:Na+/citrate or Na+/malate symporter
MMYIALIAVIGILLLQLTGAIPLANVGGSMVIALAFFLGALAVLARIVPARSIHSQSTMTACSHRSTCV